MTTPREDAPPPREGWRQHARGMVAERLGLKAIALFVSLLLWFVVHVMRYVGTTP